jgi:hypothetical protein
MRGSSVASNYGDEDEMTMEKEGEEPDSRVMTPTESPPLPQLQPPQLSAVQNIEAGLRGRGHSPAARGRSPARSDISLPSR